VRPIDLSSALRELALIRARAMTAPAKPIVGIAAVADRRVDHDLLAQVTGLPMPQLIGLLRDAVEHPDPPFREHYLCLHKGQ
jgi:hypothetical protein